MALEFGLVWGQVTLRTSLGVAYVDQEQYPEIELDGRERVVLPGVHEILIANGEVELLATVVNTRPPKCPGVVSVLNSWYGREDVPIGSYKGADLPEVTVDLDASGYESRTSAPSNLSVAYDTCVHWSTRFHSQILAIHGLSHS